MFEHTGGMMWGMGLVWVLVILVLGLSVAALIKYLRSGPDRRKNGED